MNAIELKELLNSPIAKAFAEGETVQVKLTETLWRDLRPAESPDPLRFIKYKDDFRIKPKPLVVWVNEYPKGVVCYHKTKEDADTGMKKDRIRCIKMIEAPDQTE